MVLSERRYNFKANNKIVANTFGFDLQGAAMTHAPLNAQVVVVPDPLQSDALLHWATLVIGETIAFPLWAKSAGRQGLSPCMFCVPF